MPFTVHCPHCKAKIKAPDAARGRKVPCPRCKTELEITAPQLPAIVQYEPPPVRQPVKECPFCSSAIPVNALKCRFCRETVDVRMRAVEESGRSERQSETDFQPVVNVGVQVESHGPFSLGVAGMVMSIFCLLFSFFPCAGMLSMPFSLMALVICAISIMNPKGGVGYGIVGCVFSLGALCVGCFWLMAATTVAGAVEDISKKNEAIDRQRKDEKNWTDASQLKLRIDDLEVSIPSATVGKINVNDFGFTRRSQDDVLVIQLKITNKSQGRKIDYRGFGVRTGGVTLTDNFGNSYRRVFDNITQNAEGQIGEESVHPGKSVLDLVVTEKPIEEASYLHLEIPAERLGGKEGFFRFRIPKSMIKHRQDD